MAEAPLLTVTGLRKAYGRDARRTVGLDGVNLTLAKGETLGLAGASGSGKTTLARCILRLIEPDAGTIRLAGVDLTGVTGAALRRLRPRLQMVFQDPVAAINPRATIERVLEDPLRAHNLVPHKQRRTAVHELLRKVGLSPAIAERRPHEISGGQRQRVAIARAIATRPDLIVLDEPVSALDVSVRANILNLLMDLQAEFGVAYIFVSHDLAVVRAFAHRVAIMDGGRIVETGPTSEVFRSPTAVATRQLLEAVPRLALHAN